MTHIFISITLYIFIFLCDFYSMKIIYNDIIWISIIYLCYVFYIEDFISIAFLFLMYVMFTFIEILVSFDWEFSIIIISVQYLIINIITINTHLLLFIILFELFNVSIFIIFISSRFGYKLLILWYIYIINLFTFILLYIILYIGTIYYAMIINDIIYIHVDVEVLFVFIFSISTIFIFKLYITFYIIFIEQLYVRLSTNIYIYILIFYMLFIYIFIIYLIIYIYIYILFIKISFIQLLFCALCGINTNSFIHLLFILSANNYIYLCIIIILHKNNLLLIFLQLHVLYSISLLSILYILCVFSTHDIYNYNFIDSNNMSILNHVSFINNLYSGIILIIIIFSIGSLPFTLHFLVKLILLFTSMSILSLSLISFIISFIIIIILLYIKLTIQLIYNFYNILGTIIIINSLHFYNIFILFIYIYIIDISFFFNLL